LNCFPHVLARVAVVSGLSVILSPGAQAQDNTGMPGETQAQPPGSRLERVEILARQPTDNDLRRRSQVAKQVYGREEMDQYGDTNVADVLKRLPGVSMQGNAPRMRGLGAGYTLILLNGDPAPPGFALDQLSPSQVERIEVTKGTTADQSAQAVAGAINIILKEAPRSSQRDLRLGLGYNADRPTVSGNFTFGEKWGPMSLSVPLSVFEWRRLGQSVSERTQPGTDGLISQSTQAGDQLSYGTGFNMGPRLNWRISEDETLAWQSFLQRGVWNNRSSYTNSALAGSPSLEDNGDARGTWQNVRSNLQWTNNFSAEDRIEIKAGLRSSRGTFDTQTVRDGLPQRRSIGDNTDVGVTQAGKYSRLLNESHSLTAGWDLEWRERDEKREVTERGLPQVTELEGQPFSARIARQALFLQDEWEINKQWSTYLGVRGERIRTESQGLAVALTNTSSVITPMWHVNYKLDPAGRDMVRASITRSYKAPGVSQLLSRPSISSLFPDTSKSNTELSPDRVGNPNLLPELATGLDVAFEKYLAGGGLISVSVFSRNVSDLVRNVTSLQSVGWGSAPRWVSQPVNFSKARTSGLEFEIKGRAAELLPKMFDAKTALNLRSALSFYRSSVEALPGPNNRLDGQQPWSGNVGFDYRVTGKPLTVGGSLGFTPGYLTQQTASQSLEISRARNLDMFAQWTFSRTLSLRLSANNLVPLDTNSQTLSGNGFASSTLTKARTSYSANIEMKL
jgi:outer membrane receptor for ferrienterochelin and colicins